MCLFFSSVLPCFPFFLLFLTVVLPAGKTVAAGGDDEVLCSWCPPLLLLLFFSPLSSLPVSFPLFFSLFFSFLPLSSVRFLLPPLRVFLSVLGFYL
jgi:hypothetical protein